MGAQKSVLVIDDSREIRSYLADALSSFGMSSDGVSSLREALAVAKERRHDAFIVDIALAETGTEGIDFIEAIRAWKDVRPVVVFTGIRDKDKLGRCYEVGADIVLNKPTTMKLLGAAITRVLQAVPRAIPATQDEDDFEAFGAKAVPSQMELVFANDIRVPITPKELGVLRVFAKSRGSVAKREVVLEAVWGGSHALNSNTLDTYISRIRAIYRKHNVSLDAVITAHPKVGWRISE